MFDGVTSYPYLTGVWSVSKPEMIEYVKMKKMNKMINFNDVTGEKKQVHNPNWQQIFYHPHQIQIVDSSRWRKTNALPNLIHHQLDTDKICLYAKDPYEPKYQLLINKCENVYLKYFNDP